MKNKKLSELSKDERSLLIYFESCSVDYGSKINALHMNAIDGEITERWNKEGFIGFGRIGISYITSDNRTNWVTLSSLAWKLAHQERKERFKRIYSKRNWKKTSEL